jgi:hemerythrin-like metal-binding protein
MTQIIWNDYFSVGVKKMDAQHQKFIGMLNRCLKAQEEGKLSKLTFEILKEMMNYLSLHFSEEEALMREQAYPDYEKHIQLHRNFIERTNDFLDRYATESDRDQIAGDMLDFLKDWFINHIMKIDKQYTDFFHAKGIK